VEKRRSFLSLCVLVSLFSCDPSYFDPSPSPSSSPTASPSSAPPSDFSITLSFRGPETDSNTVYVAWIEDADERNLQNLYVCDKLIVGGLTGTADPHWKRDKYPGSSLDGVTGASDQGSPGIDVTRSLNIGSVRRFRVCFEIDRSWNSNVNFYDRPAFTYRSSLIDLDDLQSPYDLSLYGWMSNDTTGNSLGQQPKVADSIPGWAAWKFMTDVSWLAPANDMVSTLEAVVSPN
jgi:hypothetical protein